MDLMNGELSKMKSSIWRNMTKEKKDLYADKAKELTLNSKNS